MSYTEPEDVDSPKELWRLLKVLRKGKKGGWAVAKGQWKQDGRWNDCLAIRWNGTDDNKLGKPQSHGKPIWFIVPNEVADLIRAALSKGCWGDDAS